MARGRQPAFDRDDVGDRLEPRRPGQDRRAVERGHIAARVGIEAHADRPAREHDRDAGHGGRGGRRSAGSVGAIGSAASADRPDRQGRRPRPVASAAPSFISTVRPGASSDRIGDGDRFDRRWQPALRSIRVLAPLRAVGAQGGRERVLEMRVGARAGDAQVRVAQEDAGDAGGEDTHAHHEHDRARPDQVRDRADDDDRQEARHRDEHVQDAEHPTPHLLGQVLLQLGLGRDRHAAVGQTGDERDDHDDRQQRRQRREVEQAARVIGALQ